MLIPNYRPLIQKALPKNPSVSDLCDALESEVIKKTRMPAGDDALLRVAYQGRTDPDAYAKLLLEIGYRAACRNIIEALSKGAVNE